MESSRRAAGASGPVRRRTRPPRDAVLPRADRSSRSSRTAPVSVASLMSTPRQRVLLDLDARDRAPSLSCGVPTLRARKRERRVARPARARSRARRTRHERRRATARATSRMVSMLSSSATESRVRASQPANGRAEAGGVGCSSAALDAGEAGARPGRGGARAPPTRAASRARARGRRRRARPTRARPRERPRRASGRSCRRRRRRASSRRHPAAARELVDELLGALLRQRDRADAGEEELLGRARAPRRSSSAARPCGLARRRLRRASRRARPTSPSRPSARPPARPRPAPGPAPARARARARRRRAADRLSARHIVRASPRARRPCGAAYSGSRSLRTARSGVAMKIVEYAPEATPTRIAKAKSLSVSPPKRSSEATGRSVMNGRRERAADRLPERLVRDRGEARLPHERRCSRGRGRR